MEFNFDAEALRTILEDAGYDVVADDVVSARKERPGLVQTVDIDRAGRVKFVRTEVEEEPTSEDVHIAGRPFCRLVERTRQSTITGQLTAPEELGELIGELERLARGQGHRPR